MSEFVIKTDAERGAEWQRLFAQRMPDIGFSLWSDAMDETAVRYLATWTLPDRLADRFPNLEVLFSTGAGVDQFDFAALPPGVRLVRLVEPGIIGGMVEYVTMAALALHRDLFTYLEQQKAALWQPIRVRPAAQRRIGIMGLGELGQAVARALLPFGFPVRGWSRSPRDIPGVACFAGQNGLKAFLPDLDILVCLLPLTNETRGILNADLFAQLPEAAALINTGRGGHLNEADFKAALESGQIARAVLDVADPEPLPPQHWIWRDPRVVVTPHIASMTQPETAVDAVIGNIRRHRAGESLVGLVDRRSGY